MPSQVVASTAMPWTVICVDTPASAQLPAEQRAPALRALVLAERLGASTDNISADSVLDRRRRTRASASARRW